MTTLRVDDVDWEGLGTYFVENTPADMTLRRFADEITETLAETGHTKLSYDTVKAQAKASGWLEKRAKYLMDRFPGLYTDAEIQYGMLMNRFMESHEDLPPRDLAALSSSISSLRDALLSRDSSQLRGTPEAEEEPITRDSVLEIISEMLTQDKMGMVRMATEVAKEEMGRQKAKVEAVLALDQQEPMGDDKAETGGNHRQAD